MGMILDDKALDKLADVLIDYQRRENTDIPILKRQLEETAQSIENMLNAIQQGILTASTKARLEQLEETKAQLEISMAQAELKKAVAVKETNPFLASPFPGHRHQQARASPAVNRQLCQCRLCVR